MTGPGCEGGGRAPLAAVALALLAALGFCLARPADTSRESAFRAVVFGDFNGAYGSTRYPAPVARTVRRIVEEWRPALVLAPGDVVAGQRASLTNAQLTAMWQAFEREVAAPLRRAGIPLALAVGNHDASSLRDAAGRFVFAREREAASRYWNDAAHRPTLAFSDRRGFPFDYAFTHRGVFFAVVDASSATLTSRTWLERTLLGPAAQQAKLRVVMGHLPLYGVSVGRNTPGNVLRGGDELRRVLERHGVHTYVSGHHAAYYPARRGQLNLLHAGGVGGRDYLGHPGTARSTVTLLDLDPVAGRIGITTYDAATGVEVSLSSLPLRLDGLNGTVTRLDLAP